MRKLTAVMIAAASICLGIITKNTMAKNNTPEPGIFGGMAPVSERLENTRVTLP